MGPNSSSSGNYDDGPRPSIELFILFLIGWLISQGSAEDVFEK